ncbi:MAG: FAD-dependent oxidoreductase [Elusimicrobia bacterium]|nr:FAD-dependent oxidoreductase [Elusimicrobiota bacterium]
MAQTWADTLSLFRKVVGDDHVVVDSAEVERRARCLIPSVQRASAFVYPSNTEQLKKILEIASAHGVPLWPCGKGKNWGYGSATPAREGAVVLVLERMNQILEINETLAYAVIEPGVTYRQLHAHIKERGLRLWLDCTDGPADGSVMGNALERGIGETPYGDHFENICGLEVLLPDGRLVRTGGGPIDGYKTWNTFKWGVGPYLEGLFSQSNYGIVTKMGLWLMPEPDCFESCLFELGREESFPRLIDTLRELAFAGALRSKVHLINDVTTFGLIEDDPRRLLDGAPCLTDDHRARLRKKYNIAPWTFGAGLYGTKAQVRAARDLIKKKLGPLGNLWFLGDRRVGALKTVLAILKRFRVHPKHRPWVDWVSRAILRKPFPCLEALPHMHSIEKGNPSDYFVKHAYMKKLGAKPADNDIDPARDHCGGIWAGIVVSLEGGEVGRVVEHCRALARKKNLDINFALMLATARSIIVLTSLFYDKTDTDETARVLALYNEIAESTQTMGYQQYRTSTAFMGRIFSKSPEFKELACRIKGVLDPGNIIAPGKYGIDPTK